MSFTFTGHDSDYQLPEGISHADSIDEIVGLQEN